MLNNIAGFAETTQNDKLGDVMDDALRCLRIGGSVLLREAYAPPCAIAIPGADKLGLFLGGGKDTFAVAFHLVEFGHCDIETASGTRFTLAAGEMAIMFGGEAHQLKNIPKPLSCRIVPGD